MCYFNFDTLCRADDSDPELFCLNVSGSGSCIFLADPDPVLNLDLRPSTEKWSNTLWFLTNPYKIRKFCWRPFTWALLFFQLGWMRSHIWIWIYIRIWHDLRVNHSWSTTLYFDFGLTRKKLINCMVYTCTIVGWPTVQLGSEYTRSAGAGHKDPGVIHASSNYQPLTPPGCQVRNAICWNIWLETGCYGTECAGDRISKNGVCWGWTVRGRNL
jgi:hypothetical protein